MWELAALTFPRTVRSAPNSDGYQCRTPAATAASIWAGWFLMAWFPSMAITTSKPERTLAFWIYVKPTLYLSHLCTQPHRLETLSQVQLPVFRSSQAALLLHSSAPESCRQSRQFWWTLIFVWLIQQERIGQSHQWGQGWGRKWGTWLLGSRGYFWSLEGTWRLKTSSGDKIFIWYMCIPNPLIQFADRWLIGLWYGSSGEGSSDLDDQRIAHLNHSWRFD